MNAEFVEHFEKRFDFIDAYLEIEDGWNELLWDVCDEIDLHTDKEFDEPFKILFVKEKLENWKYPGE